MFILSGYKSPFFVAVVLLAASRATLGADGDGAADIWLRFKVSAPQGERFRVTAGGFRHADPWYLPSLTGKARGAALREAELSLLKDAAHSHPYFWAPFVLG